MENISESAVTSSAILRTGGFCRRCNRKHWLGPGNTRYHSREVMRRLKLLGTIDLFSTQPKNIAELTTAPLFSPSRGKMFGVMECMKSDGTTTILYAFSGQYNGVWLAEGWAPPLFDIDEFIATTVEKEKQIKQLGFQIDQCTPQSDQWLAHKKKRRLLSRKLMDEIHSLYRLSNFRGETASLQEAVIDSGGIPTGTGDCCAPKLFNFAAKNNLRPVGISEFFWGRENRSGGHRHGSFASSCREKCQPILGFMLCGLEDYQLTKR